MATERSRGVRVLLGMAENKGNPTVVDISQLLERD
jgi:hypothetical protein